MGRGGSSRKTRIIFRFRKKIAFNKKQTRQKWPITTAPAPVVPVVVAAASAVAALAELAVANTFP